MDKPSRKEGNVESAGRNIIYKHYTIRAKYFDFFRLFKRVLINV